MWAYGWGITNDIGRCDNVLLGTLGTSSPSFNASHQKGTAAKR